MNGPNIPVIFTPDEGDYVRLFSYLCAVYLQLVGFISLKSHLGSAEQPKFLLNEAAFKVPYNGVELS